MVIGVIHSILVVYLYRNVPMNAYNRENSSIEFYFVLEMK